MKTHAPRWCEYGNIKFEFVDSGACDILVDFNPTKGSWSYIGTDSRYFARQGKPSMNLGWILENRSEESIRQVILHEFGHALGAVHEHESPFAKIPWNKEAVYEALSGGPNYWSREKVDQNMFTLYTLDKVQATPFDPESVMLYYYPPSWTTDGKGTAFNTDLSNADKGYIAFCYPKDTVDVVDAGQFNTQEVRAWNKPQLANKNSKLLQKKYPNPPVIALALTWLDFDSSKNIRIRAEATDITTTKFTAGLNAWADTVLYSAGMSYLELGPSFHYVQAGFFDTRDVRPWHDPKLTNLKRISFSKPFQGSAPRVVCWVNSMDFDHSKNCRLVVSVSDIDTSGFTANINSWHDSVLYGAGMTWIAYPSNQKGVASGTFNTQDVRPWNKPAAETSGAVSFGSVFNSTPKLIMGLNAIDYDCTKNLRFRCSTSSVTQAGFVWHLQSWHDSVMYSSGASWFAWS